VAGVATLAGVALAARTPGLGVPDLAQAEHHKLEAIAAWRTGHLIVDGEHPALFKSAAYLSTRIFGETALGLRVPSVIAGVASCVLVALIGRRLFGEIAGWAAGGLMALGMIAVGIDRVGKEDAVMLALTLAALLCWLRADEGARWWFGTAALAGAAAAVKYEALPLLPLLWVAGWSRLGPRPPGRVRDIALVGAAFLGVHLVLNPLLLVPAQWEFLWDFTSSLMADRPPADGSIVPTHGFAAAGDLHDAKPSWYYLLYLVLKAQPLWVAAVAGGTLLALARRRREDLLVLVWAFGYLAAISLVPFGFARYLAPALPALALLGGLAMAWLVERVGRARAPALALAAAALAAPLVVSLPYPALYVNALGGGSARALHWSPDDAGGNLGMTRAIATIAAEGVDGGTAVADPTLVRFLSGGRLRGVSVENLSADPADLRAHGVRAVVVQPSQITLGNRALFDWLSRSATPDLTVRVRGVAMVRVYRIDVAGEPRSRTRTSPTTTDRGKRIASPASRSGSVVKARPTTTARAVRAARSTSARVSAPLPTRTSEASIVSATAGRPAASGTSGRSLTIRAPGAVRARTNSATRSSRSRACAGSTTRPRTAPGRSSASATPSATACVRRARGGAADAASTAIGTERRAQ
jgi:hypothetical protein